MEMVAQIIQIVLPVRAIQPAGSGCPGPEPASPLVLCISFYNTVSSHTVQVSATRPQSPPCGAKMISKTLVLTATFAITLSMSISAVSHQLLHQPSYLRPWVWPTGMNLQL